MILREFNLEGVEKSSDLDFIYEFICKAAWAWFFANLDRDLFTAKVWILRKTFKTRDLKPAFEMIFGPAPTGTTLLPQWAPNA